MHAKVLIFKSIDCYSFFLSYIYSNIFAHVVNYYMFTHILFHLPLFVTGINPQIHKAEKKITSKINKIISTPNFTLLRMYNFTDHIIKGLLITSSFI